MRSVIRWSPARDLVSLREAMDRLVEESFVRPSWVGERTNRLPVDVYSTPEEVVILASVPGVSPDDVDISIEGDNLHIKVTYKEALENVEYIFQERTTGTFERTLTLNVPVQAEKAEAIFENGLLTLTIPKAEEIKPKVIKVQAR
ncbi:MAG: Hsp20/alpha crystallin family protein [Chloroflexota bacterium]